MKSEIAEVVGVVGVNIAVQEALATADILATKLSRGSLTAKCLAVNVRPEHVRSKEASPPAN